jgi:signal transduction histidine kinase
MSDDNTNKNSLSSYKIKLRPEVISKIEDLRQVNTSLLTANKQLKLKTEQVDAANQSLFESNHELAKVNKELATTNLMFAETNKRFAQVNDELVVANNELALTYEQIRTREKALSDFMNISAHELRTPTQSILGYAELLQLLYEKDKEKDSQKINAIDAITRNANKLQKLINEILDSSRIENQTLILYKHRFNLTQKIESLITDFRYKIINNKNKSRINSDDKDDVKIILESNEIERGSIFVKADEDRIYQVISNLLRNALEFTKKGTITITIHENKENGDVVVTVKDTGTGISPKILPRMFSKFVTDSSRGIGLGLYISKSSVEAHGGRIWTENNSDGKGAMFAFSLPVVSN